MSKKSPEPERRISIGMDIHTNPFNNSALPDERIIIYQDDGTERRIPLRYTRRKDKLVLRDS